MNIVVNSQVRIVSDGMSLKDLMAELSKQPHLVIAELNGRIVERGVWAQTTLAQGDKLELVTFVGGG